jgi:predicted GIY-YIG superfamily endonuclease
MSVVYLLHLDTPLRHARHYVGLADDLPARLERHASGQGTNAGRLPRARDWLAACQDEGVKRLDSGRGREPGLNARLSL